MLNALRHRSITICFFAAMLTLISTDVHARIKIKFLDGLDLFSYHAQVFDPEFRSRAEDIRIEAWNAAGQIYSVTIPAGACVSTNAGSCVYRDTAAKKARSGLAFFRVLYQAGKHGNKMWLESYGDLSSATDPVMSFRIYLGDVLYAHIDDEVFRPTHNGWIGF